MGLFPSLEMHAALSGAFAGSLMERPYVSLTWVPVTSCTVGSVHSCPLGLRSRRRRRQRDRRLRRTCPTMNLSSASTTLAGVIDGSSCSRTADRRNCQPDA
eukprot:1175693-Prorocentrum_minimum.AAC.4